MRIRATCSTRHDHVVVGAGDIVPLLEKGEELSLQFFQGRSALNAWLVGRRPTLERGFVDVFDTFVLTGDNGGEDYHRNPTQYFELMKKLEEVNPAAVIRGWKVQGFYSLISAVWEISRRKAPWNRHGTPWRAIGQYLRACRGE